MITLSAKLGGKKLLIYITFWYFFSLFYIATVLCICFTCLQIGGNWRIYWKYCPTTFLLFVFQTWDMTWVMDWPGNDYNCWCLKIIVFIYKWYSSSNDNSSKWEQKYLYKEAFKCFLLQIQGYCQFKNKMKIHSC